MTLFLIIFTFFTIFTLFTIFISSPIKQKTEFTISRGAGVASVAVGLQANDLVYSKTLFRASVALFGGRVQAGVYDLPRGASVWKLARKFARGDIAATTITVPEGLTVRQIENLLNVSGAACKLKFGEGDLFPNTYTIARGASNCMIISLMMDKMTAVKRGWENSGRHLPAPLKDWNEIITLASIVQKETPRVAEMPIVASVYMNRLRKRMRLQADPTVVYAITNRLGDMQGKPLLRSDLIEKSPYNTYMNYGLPVGPIANVGADAIAAVLNPADTNYLYFVADGTGGHKFSDTYQQHQANHQAWREIKKGKR
ncbi:MAG: endolytic transglycosylase MltG [Rickettsiales bacterium]|jgi:UPF0755 protein|nr:endolytic transglycosylase MltG [Rickettsiales bacterium]